LGDDYEHPIRPRGRVLIGTQIAALAVAQRAGIVILSGHRGENQT